MTKNYIFQLGIDDHSSWILFDSLRSVFEDANPANPEQAFQALQDVFDHINIVDHSQHENSPYRNRPAYLGQPAEYFMDAGEKPQPLKKLTFSCMD